MGETAKLIYNGQEYEIPIVTGTENEKALDISKLRGDSGAITLDEGFVNTGATHSAVTFLDGEKGILRYRGYPIEQLAEKSSFLEVAFLLIYGELPTKDQFEKFSYDITMHTMIHEDLKRLFDGFPKDSHPMAILSSMIVSMSGYYTDSSDPLNPKHREISMQRLLAKTPTIAAYSYKKSVGQPFVYPRNSLSYVGNFLNMMFSVPATNYEIDPVVEKALDVLLILHADHEQNCSASTVRLVGSSRANLYATIASGVCALWGPLHGGANQAVIEMLERIHNDGGGDVAKYVALAKDKNSTFRLMGFGHRVYKNFDPRARIIKKACDDLLDKLGISDPLLDIAKELEAAALSDDYFVERKLYPNVDFYSGIIYRAIGIPTEMFTVMFALGRMPGWIAQWKEMIEAGSRIGRPRQVYNGYVERDYTGFDQRK
ncbi:MAG: citrate synthase [Leptospirales bacterium]|jgi:citrate synthase